MWNRAVCAMFPGLGFRGHCVTQFRGQVYPQEKIEGCGSRVQGITKYGASSFQCAHPNHQVHPYNVVPSQPQQSEKLTFGGSS